MRGILIWVWTVVAGLSVADPARAAADPAALIPIDPAVRTGQLGNGLRYALMSNDRPVGGVSIRLRFDVGSYEEAEEERGLAHFLEHMAFNGTRRLPEGELMRRFAEAGVAFGRDQNAWTSQFATTYKLDLPDSDLEHLDLAFSWLRDIGDGLLLTPEAVERERGVVVAEYTAGLGPQKTWREAYLAFAAPDARSRTRPPIGVAETLATIDAAALTRFHQAWYRPELAVLIVAGDLPLDALESRVRATFGDWAPAGPPAARAAATPLALDRPLEVLTYSDPTLTPSVGACRLQGWRRQGPDTLERRQRNLTRSFWSRILARRFQLLSQGAEAPFASASLSASAWAREADAVCLNVVPGADGDWGRALGAALAEVRRFERDGPEPAEIQRLIEIDRRSASSFVAQAEDRFSSSLADGMLSIFALHDLDPGTFDAPSQRRDLYEQALSNVTPEAIREAFTAAWNGSEPHLALILTPPPPAEEVAGVWRTAMRAEMGARTAAGAAATWAYGDLGPPGRVVEQVSIEVPAFTRARLDNGVVLNVKSVAHTRDRITVDVRFGRGRRDVPDADYFAAGFGALFVARGGLERHSQTEIEDLFPNRQIGVDLSMGPDAFELSASTRPADLGIQLQLLTAFLSEPGFRDDYAGQRRVALDGVYRSWRTNPDAVLSEALRQALTPESPRGLPPRAAADALSMGDFERLYRTFLTSAPLEVTLVGDAPESEMIALAAATFGTLPPRGAHAGPRSDTFVLRFTDDRPEVMARHDGPADQASVLLGWPLFVTSPERRREERVIHVLRDILQDRIRDEVREALGASYTPAVSATFDDNGDQGQLGISVATSPADVDRVREAVRRVVAAAAAGGLTQADLDAALAPRLANVESNRATNAWWRNALNGSERQPHRLRDALDWEETYRSITLEEIRLAARMWLTGPAIEGVALPALETPATP
ncbi:MAG TPA: insulinase family protein [Brevundimonas sp.]|jgi:zinc protease|uniref:M16 family metallopeptidase n=1 Tax=Brevundimonas sp. TaxID=1871086 RepID=UPI002E119341|nr:insulinase family protein [Brevundimonas sp.]